MKPVVFVCPTCNKPACTIHDDHPAHVGTIVMSTTSRAEDVTERRWSTEYRTIPFRYADVEVVCIDCKTEGTVTEAELTEAVGLALRPQRRKPVRRAFQQGSTTDNDG